MTSLCTILLEEDMETDDEDVRDAACLDVKIFLSLVRVLSDVILNISNQIEQLALSINIIAAIILYKIYLHNDNFFTIK